MNFNNGINSEEAPNFYTTWQDSVTVRAGRMKPRTRRAQPSTFYNTNLAASSGVGSYDDNEEPDFTGMGAGTDQSQIKTEPWYEQVGKAVSSVLTPTNVQAYALFKLEKQRNAINLERAKNGQPPIEMATATVGLSPDTKRFIAYGAIGLVAILILPKLMKG